MRRAGCVRSFPVILCWLLVSVALRGIAEEMPVFFPKSKLVEYAVKGEAWDTLPPTLSLSGDEFPSGMNQSCMAVQPFALGLGFFYPGDDNERDLFVNLSGNAKEAQVFPCKVKWSAKGVGWTVLATYRPQDGEMPKRLSGADGNWSIQSLEISGLVAYDKAAQYPTSVSLKYKLWLAAQARPGEKAQAERHSTKLGSSIDQKSDGPGFGGENENVPAKRGVKAAAKTPKAAKTSKAGKKLEFAIELKLKGVQDVGIAGAVGDGSVDGAIARGVAYFRQNTLPGMANSVKTGKYRQGMAALVCLALIESDVAPDDPEIAALIDYTFVKMSGKLPTYDAAVSLMLLESAARHSASAKLGMHSKERLRGAERLKDSLQAGSGHMWTYNGRVTAGGDYSNTQYAMLGLRAAVQLGLTVNKRLWEELIQGWLKDRIDVKGKVKLDVGRKDGYYDYSNYPGYNDSPYMAAWPYKQGGSASVNMTLGMLSNFAVATEAMKKSPEGQVASAIFDGMTYLQSIMEDTLDKAAGYTLYGVERLGVFYKIDRIGTVEWYPRGARTLIEAQEPAGSWNMQFGKDVSTAYALLFLKKGSRVLEYDVVDDRYYKPSGAQDGAPAAPQNQDQNNE